MTELVRNLATLRVQAQVVQQNPGLPGSAIDTSSMTLVPAQAPAAVEPAIRDAYEKASRTLDGR